jgi:hypothetical protein
VYIIPSSLVRGKEGMKEEGKHREEGEGKKIASNTRESIEFIK